MIHTDFNWNEAINWVQLIAASALLVVQCVLLYTRHRGSGRAGVRIALNGLLWVSVVAWMLDPYFKSDAGTKIGLLIAKNVPSEIAGHIRDSLVGTEVIRTGEIGNRPVDTLVMVGQAFDETAFAAIRQSRNVPYLYWEPYFAPDELRDLHWKGVLRKGEMQRVEGSIQTANKKMLQVKYAGQILDSVMLHAGNNNFKLAFPAFSEGRTTTTLDLDGQTIDTIRFFAQPGHKLTIRFLLDSPDFETRNLATWLGKQGHAVLYDATLSKNIRSQLNINRVIEPDLIVTSASNAAGPTVRKASNAGKSILFLQLGDHVTELPTINNALGTRFGAVKISNEESVALSGTLTARPFRFEPRGFQTQAPHYPVAIEKVTGKIAVSLLNETFPMQLSGDSITYGKVWNEILAYMRPAQAPVTEWDAPVFQNAPAMLHLNNFQPLPQFVTIASDTIFTAVSALNDRSANATFLPGQNGWLPLHDSLDTEMYVQDYSSLQYASCMQYFIRSTQKINATNTTRELISTRKLPGWAWFVWLMLCLTALWIEPKL